MQAHYFERYGKRVRGKIGEFPEPIIERTDILIQVSAASVNPIDFKMRDGKVRLVYKAVFPLILGGDGSGTVIRVGESVKKFKVGDEVYFRVRKGGQGTFAERIALPEECVAKKPKSISLLEAAGLPLVGLTSIQALFDVAGLKSGQRVFIPAGSGGVGSLAIQIAKANGLWVATTTSTKNLEMVRGFGPDCIIDYTKEDFRKTLQPVDAVYDTLGGKEQMRSFRLLKKGGTLVSIVGPPTAELAKDFALGPVKTALLAAIGFPSQMMARFRGARYSFLLMRPSGEQLERLAQWVDQGKVRPVIDRVFSLSQVDEALAYLVKGRARGKVLIKIE